MPGSSSAAVKGATLPRGTTRWFLCPHWYCLHQQRSGASKQRVRCRVCREWMVPTGVDRELTPAEAKGWTRDPKPRLHQAPPPLTHREAKDYQTFVARTTSPAATAATPLGSLEDPYETASRVTPAAGLQVIEDPYAPG